MIKVIITCLVGLLLAFVSEAETFRDYDTIVADTRRDTLAEAKITSERYAAVAKTQTGHKKLDRNDFIYGTIVFSSPDIIKSIQNLPGVSAGTELMSGLYVHGGDGSDNIFLLDGVPMYQISHLGGLFSSFNTDIIESLDFYKSGFPARYGGRLSSVVDVTTKDGDFEEYHGSFMVGLIDGRLQFEGPIVKNKTSFNIAIRRSWLDAVLAPTIAYVNNTNDGETVGGNYAFHDINASVTHRFDARNKLSFKAYWGRDRLKLEHDLESYMINADVAWGNMLASLNWNSTINDRMQLNTTAYYSGSNGDLWYEWHNEMQEDGTGHHDTVDETNISDVSDIGIVTDMVWRPLKNHYFRMGASYRHHIYKPERHSVIDNDGSVLETEYGDRYNGDEFAVYAEDEMNLGDRITLNTGLRYVIFSVPEKFRHAVEPRIAVQVQCSEAVDIRLAYSHMNQFAHLISTNYMDLPTNCWLPSTASIDPMHSKQLAGGVYTKLPMNFRFNIEGYYKTMDNLLEYAGSNLFFPPLDSWETSFLKGKGRAYGMETEFGWDSSSISLTAYYTLSWSERKFDEIWPEWYPHRYDNRHKLTLMGIWKVRDGIDIYANWNYNSGGWMSAPTHIFHPDEDIFDRVYTAPNNINLPDYHRLDLGINFIKTTRRGNERTWNIGIYNAYCRKNVVFVAIDQKEDNSLYGTGRAIFPIIPSFSYSLKF